MLTPALAIRSPKAIAWTRDDCARLADAGLLPERYELIAGEIISKMGQNLPHGDAVMLVLGWLMSVFGGAFLLTHTSIDVAPQDNPTSQPEPDITVLNKVRSKLKRNPEPGDIALLVEVSDTTLTYDLTVKRDLYARAGIQEYWVIDVNARRIHVFRGPALQEAAILEGTQSLAPLARPDSSITIAALLG